MGDDMFIIAYEQAVIMHDQRHIHVIMNIIVNPTPDDHFSGQKAILGTIWGLKTACFAHEMAPRGAPKVRNWVSDTWTIMW